MIWGNKICMFCVAVWLSLYTVNCKVLCNVVCGVVWCDAAAVRGMSTKFRVGVWAAMVTSVPNPGHGTVHAYHTYHKYYKYYKYYEYPGTKGQCDDITG